MRRDWRRKTKTLLLGFLLISAGLSEGQEWQVGSVVVGFRVFGAPRFSVQKSQEHLLQRALGPLDGKSEHLKNANWEPGLKPQKGLEKVSRGGASNPGTPRESGKSLEKVFRDLFKTFSRLSRLFRDVFQTLGGSRAGGSGRLFSDFFGVSGPEGPSDPCNGQRAPKTRNPTTTDPTEVENKIRAKFWCAPKSVKQCLTCFHASFFPFCPLCWPPLFLPFSRHIFALFSPSKIAQFCRAKGTAQSLERGNAGMELSTDFGKEIPSRNLREKGSEV